MNSTPSIPDDLALNDPPFTDHLHPQYPIPSSSISIGGHSDYGHHDLGFQSSLSFQATHDPSHDPTHDPTLDHPPTGIPHGQLEDLDPPLHQEQLRRLERQDKLLSQQMRDLDHQRKAQLRDFGTTSSIQSQHPSSHHSCTSSTCLYHHPERSRAYQQLDISANAPPELFTGATCPICEEYNKDQVHTSSTPNFIQATMFESDEALRLHVKNVHGGRWLCVACCTPTLFDTKPHFQLHMMNEHFSKLDPRRPFICLEFCGANFMESSHLERHLWLHQGLPRMDTTISLPSLPYANLPSFHDYAALNPYGRPQLEATPLETTRLESTHLEPTHIAPSSSVHPFASFPIFRNAITNANQSNTLTAMAFNSSALAFHNTRPHHEFKPRSMSTSKINRHGRRDPDETESEYSQVSSSDSEDSELAIKRKRKKQKISSKIPSKISSTSTTAAATSDSSTPVPARRKNNGSSEQGTPPKAKKKPKDKAAPGETSYHRIKFDDDAKDGANVKGGTKEGKLLKLLFIYLNINFPRNQWHRREDIVPDFENERDNLRTGDKPSQFSRDQALMDLATKAQSTGISHTLAHISQRHPSATQQESERVKGFYEKKEGGKFFMRITC